ncbi:MAG: T9SS type A sorting domain-containing protein, partial [Saprospiraceae bacterium]
CMAYGNIVLAAPLLAGPLPVVLQKFEALADPCGPIQLTWNTVSEQNSREFVIERSMDGKQFDKIGHVMSHNKSSGSNYIYIDSEAQNKSDKTIFYRLRHYDFDGTENIHKVIRHYYMCSDAIPSLSVSPNPAANLITIYVTDAKNEDEVSIIIRSIHGSILKTANLSEANQEQQINISQLPAGIYSVEAKGKYLKTTTVFTKVD